VPLDLLAGEDPDELTLALTDPAVAYSGFVSLSGQVLCGGPPQSVTFDFGNQAHVVQPIPGTFADGKTELDVVNSANCVANPLQLVMLDKNGAQLTFTSDLTDPTQQQQLSTGVLYTLTSASSQVWVLVEQMSSLSIRLLVVADERAYEKMSGKLLYQAWGAQSPALALSLGCTYIKYTRDSAGHLQPDEWTMVLPCDSEVAKSQGLTCSSYLTPPSTPGKFSVSPPVIAYYDCDSISFNNGAAYNTYLDMIATNGVLTDSANVGGSDSSCPGGWGSSSNNPASITYCSSIAAGTNPIEDTINIDSGKNSPVYGVPQACYRYVTVGGQALTTANSGSQSDLWVLRAKFGTDIAVPAKGVGFSWQAVAQAGASNSNQYSWQGLPTTTGDQVKFVGSALTVFEVADPSSPPAVTTYYANTDDANQKDQQLVNLQTLIKQTAPRIYAFGYQLNPGATGSCAATGTTPQSGLEEL
jgi:hypothetical protein